MLDLVLTKKEGLAGNVKLKGSLGCSDHEMVQLKILRALRKVHSKLNTLDFRKADFGLFRDLLCRVPWDKALKGRWDTSKLVNTQGSPSPNSGTTHANKEAVRQKHQEACMDEQAAAGQTPRQKGSLQGVEGRKDSLRGIQRNCSSSEGSG